MVGAQWLLARSGPGATNHFEGGGFVRGNEEVAYPNLMFHFLPIAIRYDGSAPAGQHGYQVHNGPMNSDARGQVRITSADPTRPGPARPGPASGYPVQLPVHRAGPAGMGAGHSRGAAYSQSAGLSAVQRG